MNAAVQTFKNFTTGVGRYIGGGFDLVQKRDKNNQPIVKDGKPVMSVDFGIAFAKTGPYGAGGAQATTTHWNQLGPWAADIFTMGHTAHPMAAQRADFSWKVTDGDSTIPNKRGKIPNQQEGQAGHWIFWFSSQRVPQLCQVSAGRVELIDKALIKKGFYVQVQGSVKGNTGDSPGVYLNHSAVCLAGHGPEIFSGPDIHEAGFGAAPLPAGASAQPVAALAPAGTPQPAAVAVAPVVAQPAPLALTPQPSFLAAPIGQAAPALTPTPPAPVVAAPPAPVRQMTPKAGGATYEQFMAIPGWTDELLRAQGYMV